MLHILAKFQAFHRQNKIMWSDGSTESVDECFYEYPSAPWMSSSGPSNNIRVLHGGLFIFGYTSRGLQVLNTKSVPPPSPTPEVHPVGS